MGSNAELITRNLKKNFTIKTVSLIFFNDCISIAMLMIKLGNTSFNLKVFCCACKFELILTVSN